MADTYSFCCITGSRAAQRLTEEGFPVTAWNRDSSKAEALSKAGVESNENLTDAVGEADVALLLLADANAIESVLMQDESVLAALKGRTVLQMGTIGEDISATASPDLSVPRAQLRFGVVKTTFAAFCMALQLASCHVMLPQSRRWWFDAALRTCTAAVAATFYIHIQASSGHLPLMPNHC